jgi:uncharacterized repeat protein (TIGR03803 family)
MTIAFALQTPQPAEAQTFSILHDFTGGADGGWPVGPLREGPDNELYGATNVGGTHNYGEVFRMTKDGDEPF